jgi:hypothetical protein
MPPVQPLELTGTPGEGHVFTTIPAQRGEVLTIDLKPNFISLGLPREVFKPDLQGGTGGKLFDAAVGGGTTFPGIVWIFTGEDYVRLNLRTNDLAGPATISGNWGSGHWPSSFASGVDAAVTFTNAPGFAWFFKGGQYLRYNLATDIVEGGPVEIRPNWPGWPDSFASGVDAAIPGRGAAFEGMAWFFKGSEYFRFNNNSGVVKVDVGPTPIAAAWRGWPERFTSVDCAISGVGTESAVIYFLKGDEFIKYDLEVDEVISQPAPITSKWSVLAPFLRRPQLFLVEALRLSTYYGDILAGPVQTSASPPLPGGATQTYTVIVRRTATETVTETTTILESQDQTLVDDVNSSMREDAASQHSTEHYDYKFDSSFEGDLDYTGLGGSVDATLNFQGSSNDVRDKASKAAMNAVQKQVSRTERSRRQSTQVVEGTHTATSEFESTFTQTVHNPTSRAISLGLFQLVQEYVALTVLSDVRVAFSNGDRPDMVSLERLDLLLARCVADANTARFIKDAVLAELRALLDYRRRPATVLRKIDDTRVVFDPEVTSTFTLVNPDGTPRRNIKVNGVIVGTHPFNQLTQASLIKELEVG